MNALILDQTALAEHYRPRDCGLLDEVLLHALLGSEYRFGTLNFPEPLEEDYPDFIEEPPDCLKGGWTHVHEIDMVLHAARGALLLRDCSLYPDEPRGLLRLRIEETHRELVDLQRKLRRRLDEDEFWRSRPIVLGVGVVVREHITDDDIPAGIPSELLIDESELDLLPRRLERLFAFHTTPCAKPVKKYGNRLLATLTNKSGPLGEFFDQERMLDLYNGFYEEADVA